MSRRRSPARWLGPLALLVAAAAILMTVQASTKSDEKADKPKAAQKRASGSKSQGKRSRTRTTPASKRKTYKVKAGDTLGAISEKTGVTIDELVRLNPDIDSSSLTIGQTLRLTQ
jgi:LysM repeat protein